MRAVVGLGANLGDRRASIDRAIDDIAAIAVVRARSRVYETDPVGPPQPRYLNAAIAIETKLEPDALMKALLAIEASMGRVRAEKNGPRTIDLDVLWIEGVTQSSDVLVVPHPRLRERAFALGPLVEVAPDARDPMTNEPYAAMAIDRSALTPT